MKGVLIYHKQRIAKSFNGKTIYFDKIFRNNQDPYIWNKKFLHTFCHMPKVRPHVEVGSINFWVCGDAWPEFNKLYCDLVFVVGDIEKWETPNFINKQDKIVDSPEAYNDHYQWAMYQHQFKDGRERVTLKANPNESFQPLDKNYQRIEILDFLNTQSISTSFLRNKMRANKTTSQPLPLEEIIPGITLKLYQWVSKMAEIKLRGIDLEKIRKANKMLASLPPK